MGAALRKIPSVDQVLQAAGAAALAETYGREQVVEAVRAQLATLRERLRATAPSATPALPTLPALLAAVGAALAAKRRARIRRAVNATGIILHTGLGRAVLPEAAIEAIAAAHRSYALVAVEQETGDRLWREHPIAELLRELTGAEAATVVNNNAAATLLILTELARGREVITSRGQLVEIGGSFRLPDVMAMSGARLVEVGTTNKTYLRDYERALTPATGLLLNVHTSNYKIVGFTESVPTAELVGLGRKAGVPVVDDIGSGALVDFSALGLPDEPIVARSVAAGADLVCFSADKLIGGPQAGIVVGRKDTVVRLRKNPLFRALRSDKLTLSALEATLKLYLDKSTLFAAVPTLAMVSLPPAEILRRARRLRALIRSLPEVETALAPDGSQLGGGSMPGFDLPTTVVTLGTRRLSAEKLALALRRNEPPIFARINKDRLLFDPRTLLPGDDREIAAALVRILA
ncbi:MAG: L-seryl-tRNA(Sec) selenium transferase [Planctomycetes bacterium]|nr:L-seryl-tRNA(Sec) selenium transferase [Planctomycetota bacterium]